MDDQTFPDVGSMSNQELKQLISELTEEEREVSYRRRLLHGRIDLLRAELVGRLRSGRQSGDSLITGGDVEALSRILAGRVPAVEEESGDEEEG